MSNIKDKLTHKYENQEISKEEYEELLIKLESLNLLNTNPVEKEAYDILSVHGKKSLLNCMADRVNVTGKLVVDQNLVTNDLFVSGVVSVANNLTVSNATKISGKLHVDGEAKLAKGTRIAGKVDVTKNLYISDEFSVAGKIKVGNDIISNGELKVAGKLFAHNIKSSSTVTISGKIVVEEHVIAQLFTANSSTSIIGGNLLAESVVVNQKYRLQTSIPPESDNITDLPSLAKFLTRVIKNTNFSYQYDSSSAPFEVKGNIECSSADLSNIAVYGDIIADDVVLGPDVVVHGIVKYRNSISYPEDLDISTEKIIS